MSEKRIKKEYVFYLINIFFGLILGLLIYIVFRPDTYISKYFSELTHLRPIAIDMSEKKNSIAVVFAQNYLGDFLWAYAMTFSVQVFLNAKHKKEYIELVISCFLFEILIEVTQKLNIISGTFDLYDIILEMFATGSAVLIIYIVKREAYEEN